MKFPARTTLEGIPENMPMGEFDLQTHLDTLSSKKFEADEFAL